MRKYTDPQNTPLIFHTFVRFVFFPLGMLATLANIFLLLPYMGTNFAALIAVPLYIAYFIASLACVVGFGKWKSYSWYALLWALGLRVVDQLLASGLDFYAGVSSSNIASEIIGCLIANGLIFLYYYKRRALFFRSETPQPAEPTKAPESASDSSPESSKSESPSLFHVLPPVLYGEPESIPRKYSGSYYTFTGDTQKDLQSLLYGYNLTSTQVDSVMKQMDQIGNNPGNPERERLSNELLANQIAQTCFGNIVAAIGPGVNPSPSEKLEDIQMRNVQFQFDHMCDLVRDLYLLRVDLSSCRDNPERQKGLEAQISVLENNISDAQVQIFRIYRM